MRGGTAPSALPEMQALRPSKGDGVRLCLTLLPDEKVTKESPRGVPPLGTPLGGHYHPPSNASVAPPERGATPGSTQKPNPPAAPRISSRKCFSGKALGENKARLPTQLKVANRSRLVAETLSRGCGLPQGERSVPLGDSKGRSPWRAFGDFPRDGKVTRGGGAERPPSGGRSQVCRLAPGAQPPLGECRGAAPLVHPSQRAGATAGATAPERKKKG